jgi:hypothetical protein
LRLCGAKWVVLAVTTLVELTCHWGPPSPSHGATSLLCARPPLRILELYSSRTSTAALLHPDTNGHTLGLSLLILSMTVVGALLVNLGVGYPCGREAFM